MFLNRYILLLILGLNCLAFGCASVKNNEFSSQEVKRNKEVKTPFAKKPKNAAKKDTKSSFSINWKKNKKTSAPTDQFSSKSGYGKSKKSGDSFSSRSKEKAYTNNDRKGLLVRMKLRQPKNDRNSGSDAFSSTGRKSRRGNGDSFSSKPKEKAYANNNRKGLLVRMKLRQPKNDRNSGSDAFSSAGRKSRKGNSDSFSSKPKEKAYANNNRKGLLVRMKLRQPKNDRNSGSDAFASSGRRGRKSSGSDAFSSEKKSKAYDNNNRRGLLVRMKLRQPKNDRNSGSDAFASTCRGKRKGLGSDAFASERKGKAYDNNKKKGLLVKLKLKQQKNDKNSGSDAFASSSVKGERKAQGDAFSSSYKEKAYEKNKNKKPFLAYFGIHRNKRSPQDNGNDHFSDKKYKTKARKPQMGLFPQGMQK